MARKNPSRKQVRKKESGLLASLFARPQAYVGIDLGASTIKLTEVRGAKITRFIQVPTPAGAIVEGEIANPLAILDTLEQLVKENKLQKHLAIAAISGKSVVTRQIRLPVIPEEELTTALRWEAEKYIPLPFEELVFDYVNLGEVEGEGGPNLLILIAAVPKKVVEPLVEILQEVKLKPLAVEIPTIALWRSLAPQPLIGPLEEAAASSLRELLLERQKSAVSHCVACLDIGDQSSSIVFFKDRVLQYNRSIPFGSRELTDNLVQIMGISPEEAERMKIQEGILLNEEEAQSAEPRQSEIDFNLRSILNDLVIETKRSLDFFKMQSKNPVERLILTGGTAQLQGLTAFLSEGVGVPVEVAAPFENLGKFGVTVNQHGANGYSPAMLISLGLALREVID